MATIKVKQTKSAIGRLPKHKARGMINRVYYMVEIVEE
jgi:large subunit ribosomal protein L30